MKQAKLEFVARITTEDGEIIERRVETMDGIIPPEELDFSNMDHFLAQFDAYERSALSARNQVCEDITQAWVEEQAKKEVQRNSEKCANAPLRVR